MSEILGIARKAAAYAQAGVGRSDQLRMRFVHCACAVVAAGLAAIGLACGSEDAPTLRIGLSPWPGYELLYLAQEKGLYDEREGPIRVVEHTSIDDARRAYLRGQTDAFGATLVELLLTREQGPRTPTAFLAVDVSNGADVLIARSPIKDPSDLRGKRVGIEPGSLGVLLVARALERVGLGLSDVTLHWIDGAAIANAFTQLEIDAAATYPPHALPMLEAGGRAIFSSTEIPGEIVDVILIDAERLRRRPGDAQRVIDGFRRARDYARAHPEEAISIMAAREGLTPAEFSQTIESGIDRVEPEDQVAVLARGGSAERALQKLEQAMRRIGLVTGQGCRAGCITPPAISLARRGDG